MRGGQLFPVGDDWYEWRQEPPLPATVLVRVGGAPGGRILLLGLRIDGAPTAELLRGIPVGRIEAAANAQLTFVDDVLVRLPDRRAVATRPRWPSGASPLAPEPLAGWETTDPATAARRPARRPRTAAGTVRRGRPDRFYHDVATAYLKPAQVSPRPVAELAQANGIPQTTAHRWIREARRRGYLPPGRPGKAG